MKFASSPGARHRAGVFAVVILGGTGLLVGLFHRAGREREPKSETTAFVLGLNLSSTLPRMVGPAGYVGSASCKECHSKEYESWHRSYHRTMTQVMTTNSVVANFLRAQLEFMGEQFTLNRAGNEFWVEIQNLAEVAQARATNGTPTPPVRVRMGLVTGSHHMQVFWLPTEAGNMQIGFPFTWLIEDRRWVPRNDAFIRDPKSVPAKEIWNLTCIRCHTTAAQPRPDYQEDVFNTRVAELGISCEACHGPAEPHVANQRLLAARSMPESERPVDRTIVQPRDLDHVRGSQICGFCHSMKWFDDSEGWKQDGFRFRPGDDLEQTTPIIRPKNLESQPWLHNVLAKSPDLLEDFFWPDGMVRVAGREFNGLIESPCYQRGALSCFSCHSMHQSDPDDQLARGRDGNRACLQCHSEFEQKLAEHSHHSPDSAGSLCYNCHMPHTTYALLKAIRSHQIDSPNVQTTLKTGRPNACNLCHLDQPLGWTSEHLSAWYGQPKTELAHEQRAVAGSLVWLLSGDAGQRALAAWAMGWDAARQVSGQNWQAPHLAHLLDDPYSAVRYIADRSLRQYPGFGDLNYDFVDAPEKRKRASQQALAKWSQQLVKVEPGVASRVLLRPDGSLNTEAAGRLHQQRDDRPMRLRE